VPRASGKPIGNAEIRKLKAAVLKSKLPVGDLVAVAWASASTFRGGDKRGGANGARIRLAPMKDWAVNQPAQLQKVLGVLTRIQTDFNAKAPRGMKLSMADLIVLAGSAAVEAAAIKGGVKLSVPFQPGRTDATPEQTDVPSFAAMEPAADGFRNYLGGRYSVGGEHLLVDKAQQLTLTAPEMTALVGGLRVLGANHGGSKHGVFTNKPGTLTNDFFVNLLDIDTQWKPSGDHYQGTDRSSGKVRWTGTRVDLVFGSNAVLRALAEVYASGDGRRKLVTDFVAAWTKVMDLDRYDLKR
jgi:catalase-peroxidase